jgi:hypothetical protein
MLKHEVCMRFDGDANILISSIINRMPKYLKFERDNQNSNLVGESDLLASFNFDILANAAINFPQMQIAVQTDAENWNATTFIPKVVYISSSYNESTSVSVEGYDNNQNPISVSTLVDPTDNYVVVSMNERTVNRTSDNILVSRLSYCPILDIVNNAPYNPENTPNLIELPNDCNGGGSGGGGGNTSNPHPQYLGIGQDGARPTLVGSQMGTVVASPNNGTFNILNPVGTLNGVDVFRKNFRHERMREIRCDDIGNIEGWPAGAPEIRMHVFEQNILNPSENLQIYKEEFEPSKRKDIRDKWWDASGVTMHLWDYSGTGTKASFGYYEFDPVILPNETLVSIGEFIVDLITIVSPSNQQTTLSGNIRTSVATGIRSLKKKNGMSEYIGKDDYSIFNNQDQFNHSPGGTKFKTWPDL